MPTKPATKPTRKKAVSTPRPKAARKPKALSLKTVVLDALGDMKALERIYAKHLKTPQAKEELDELSSLVMKAGPVCILCYERDHAHCHRKWIAEIIEERDGVKVENLLAPQL